MQELGLQTMLLRLSLLEMLPVLVLKFTKQLLLMETLRLLL